MITALTQPFILRIINRMTELSTPRRRSGGPPLGALAIVSLVLTVAGVITLIAGTGSAPDFFAAPAHVAAWYAAAPVAVRAAALLQFGASVPLGIFAATAYARQLRLGVRVPGPVIGLCGGVAASLFLAVSALILWAASFPAGAGSDGAVALLSRLSFALGGVGYATGLGLLLAGIAVPAVILGLLPRWLGVVGLVLAALGEVSFLSLAVEPLQALLPIVRFGGGLWLIAAGFLLPLDRPRRAPRVAESVGDAGARR